VRSLLGGKDFTGRLGLSCDHSPPTIRPNLR
jgi:hypothetical protein